MIPLEQRYHGYAIVRGGTAYPFEGNVYDIVAVEMLKPDSAIVGPLAGPGGRPRGRTALRVAAADVIARLTKYPKPSTVYACLRHQAAQEVAAPLRWSDPTSRFRRTNPLDVAPSVTLAALDSSALKPVTLAFHLTARPPETPVHA